MSRSRVIAVLVCCGLVATAAQRSAAQLPPVEVTLPPTLLLPNYDRVQIGQREGLEAGAFVARTDDAAANWYNPAGLVRSEKSAINASAVAYEWTTLGVEGLGEKTTRSRFSTISTLIAGVIGGPIISSNRWRLGFAGTTPEYWAPGTMNEAFEQPRGNAGTERFSYGSQISFSSLWPSVSVAYAARPALRLGATLEFARTSLDQLSDNGVRALSVDSSVTRLTTFKTSGTSLEALFALGAHWDFASTWTLGAIVTSPGARVRGQSSIDGQSSAGGTPGYADLYFRDTEARFEYKHPWRAAAGLSHDFHRGSVEADVRYHGSTETYSVFSSTAQGRRVVSTPGNAPVVTAVVFRDVTYKARAVWNYAAGGRYLFTKHWTGHAGFYTDTSPVDTSQQTIFRKTDLVGFTGGATLSGDHLSGSLGLGYSTGTSSDVLLGVLPDGTEVRSKASISSYNLSYAVSYTF